MARRAEELTAIGVSRLNAPGLHFVGGVPGLALQVLPTGGRSWVLRMTIADKRRDMGLGGFPGVTLAAARETARDARMKLRAGIDPIEDARSKLSLLKSSQASAVNFEDCAERYIAAQESGWKSMKSAQQWRNTLATYAYPEFGALLVRDVNVSHVLNAIEPLWSTKTETATRLRGRIEAVLDWATARGYRHGENPARWKGHLAKLLPAASKVAKTKHHAALSYDSMVAFMPRLRAVEGMGAKALEFAILTAARSGEVRGATWEEFDMGAGVWTIPGERMKAAKEHRVPLSPAALQLLNALPRIAGSPYVFPAVRGGMLSDMTLTAVLRRLDVPAVPHGFRSTFRDWAAERTNYPNHVAEMALAHSIGDAVEAAYRRGDLFRKRTKMMADWAAFCAKTEADSSKVVPINGASAKSAA